MKKFVCTLLSLAMASMLSVSAFASDFSSFRAVVCPMCGRAPLVEVRGPETRTNKVYESCTHGKTGVDEYKLHYYLYIVRCSASCGYSESSQERMTYKEYIQCGGI